MQDFTIYGHRDVAEAGYPEVLCPVIFLSGCNFKCPYCLNAKLVKKENLKEYSLIDTLKLYKDLNNDKILISGGEPLLNKDIFEIIEMVKENGFNVRIATNGSFPNVLKKIIDLKLISFIAMDIKTGFNLDKWKLICDNIETINCVIESIKIIETSNISYEFRTTLFPPLVGKEDIISISNHIDCSSMWFLQPFRIKEKLLGGNFIGKINLYKDNEINDFIDVAKKIINNVKVRDV